MTVTTQRSTSGDETVADAAAQPATGSATPVRRPGRGRVLLALGLVVVVVAASAVLVWERAGRASAAGGLDHPDEREQVMSLTSQFVKRLGTYSPDMVDASGQMPDYRAQVREVITPKFAADFDTEVTTAEQLVAQGQITRTTDVFATAVSSVDDDSARVLVAGAFTDSYTQGTGDKARTVDQEPLPFRFTVDLVLSGGTWLVDDFAPVSSAGDEADPGTRSDDPTEGSTP